MKRRLAVCLALSVLLAAPPAPAQAPSPDNVQQGRAEFDAGRDALKLGDLQAALAHFRKSLALNRAPGTLLNLASVEEKIGMFASASAHYGEALTLLPAADPRVKIARERMKDIEPRIAAVRVKLEPATAAAGATVSFDGKAISAADLATELPADPGSHVLLVSAPGHDDRRYELMLKSGERQTILVPALSPRAAAPEPAPPPTATPTLGPPTPPPPTALDPSLAVPPSWREPPPAPATGNVLRTAGFVVLGVGAAAAIAGAVTGGLSLGKKQELEGACSSGTPHTCDPALEPTHSAGETLAHASTATFVLAGVGVAAGAALVIVSFRKGPDQPSAKVAVGPASISLQGRF